MILTMKLNTQVGQMLVVIIVWQPVQIQMASFFKKGQVRDESLIFIAFSIGEFSFENRRLITFLGEIRLSSKWSCLWHVLLLTSRICERNKITDHSLLKYELLDDKTFTFSTTWSIGIAKIDPCPGSE